MKPTIHSVIVCATLFIFSAACSAQPAESDGRKAVQRKIDQESQQRIELVSFTKTNGQKAKFMGVDIYIMSISVEIAFTERCKWFHHPMYPMSMRTEPVKNLQGWAKFNEDIQPDRAGEIVRKGDRRKVTGTILFEKTENGWEPTFRE
jgi:hypothetical protein